MSIFPFIDEETINDSEETELLIFKEYAFDFENNRFKLNNQGKHYLIEKNDALRIWIYKSLSTERFRYLAYSHDFGNEIESLIGTTIDEEIIYSELQRFIIEALMINPYIDELKDFEFYKEGSKVIVNFVTETIYGTMKIAHDWRI